MRNLIWITVIIALIIGCSTTRPPLTSKSYSFNYDGSIYYIESMTPGSKEGYNLLLHKDGNRILLRAIDKEQDGKIDKVIQGDVSKEEANAIYQSGITSAKTSRNLHKRKFPNAYKTSDLFNDYELRTFILTIGETYNRLSIVNRETLDEETILLDLLADGSLNKLEKGSETMIYYQNLYNKILDQGVKEGQVIKGDGIYRVALGK